MFYVAVFARKFHFECSPKLNETNGPVSRDPAYEWLCSDEVIKILCICNLFQTNCNANHCDVLSMQSHAFT